MPQAPVTLHLITPEWEAEEPPENWLDREELERAGRFVFARDAARWRIYRAKAKRLLAGGGAVPTWQQGPAGKPWVAVPELEFNLSHSDRLAALLVSRAGPVGVDLEPLDRAHELLDCEDSFCHPAELGALPAAADARSRELLQLWTAKEAFLKAIGTGLGFPPTRLRIEGSRVVEGPVECRAFHLVRPALPARLGHCLAAVVPLEVTEVRMA